MVLVRTYGDIIAKKIIQNKKWIHSVRCPNCDEQRYTRYNIWKCQSCLKWFKTSQTCTICSQFNEMDMVY